MKHLLKLTLFLMLCMQAETLNARTNYALVFGNSNDYVSIPNTAVSSVTTTATFEAWVKPANDNETGRIIDHLTPGVNDGFLFDLESGKVRIIFGDYWAEGSTVLLANTWYHVAATSNGSALCVYVNGVLDASATVSGSMPANTYSVFLGIDQSGGNHFLGMMDEVRIWNIARSDSELQASMNSSLTGRESGLIGYWPMNEGSGTTTYDQTGNGNDGTLINFSLTSGSGWVAGNNSITCNTPKPTVASKQVCGNGDLTLSVTSEVNGTINWYTNSDLSDTPVTGNSITATGTTTYYVTEFDGCESDTTIATITVYPIIDIDVESAVCADAGEITLTAQTGGVFTIDGEVVTSYNPADYTDGLTIIYTLIEGTCQNVDTINVTVTSVTEPEIETHDYSILIGETIPPLTASASGTITWYNSSMVVLVIGTSYIPNIDNTIESRNLFYVTNTINGCESDPVAVLFTVTACSLNAPVVSSTYTICDGEDFPTITPTGIGSGNSVNWYSYSGVDLITTADSYQPTAAGTYYVSQQGDCESTQASFKIVVNSLPDVSFYGLPDVYADGNAIILSSYATPAGGEFTGEGVSNGIFTPASDLIGDVEITYTYTSSTTGCSNTAVDTITVMGKPTYTITASAGEGGSISPSGDVSVKEGSGQSFTIAANSGYTISDVLVDGTSAGVTSSYTFSSVTANHTITVSFKVTTGVEENGLSDISIYPNPCSTGFTIHAGEKESTLYIVDLTGKLMLSKQVSGRTYVDTDALKAGVYLVKVEGEIYKLIKE